MEEEKRVTFGESNRAVAFLSDGENDQEVVKETFKSVHRDEIPETSDFILQVRDEEWARGGEFVDISPSQTHFSFCKAHPCTVHFKRVTIN